MPRDPSADTNVMVTKPQASNRSLVASSMLESSSTTATTFCRLGMDISLGSLGAFLQSAGTG